MEDDELVEEEAIEVSKTKPIGNDLEDISLESNQMSNIKESKSHPLENVIEETALPSPQRSASNIVRAEKACQTRIWIETRSRTICNRFRPIFHIG
ncbi:hypothetical protein Tco_0751208 [Tanacetum coccineum]|uniref:Uncharacterized protein n=1 Tax=Tanacetum coccineum TaxID=301880 RepID=A0ABQ4Z679_9ASTR